jgi:hypothetical protein
MLNKIKRQYEPVLIFSFVSFCLLSLPIILLLCHLDVGILNVSFVVSGTETSRAIEYDLLFPKETQAQPELLVGVCVDEGIDCRSCKLEIPCRCL